MLYEEVSISGLSLARRTLGYSQPVTLLIDGDAEVGQIADHVGYLFFSAAEAFKRYVNKVILVMHETAD